MEKRFVVSSSPHYRAEDTTRSVMLCVVNALIPALIAAVFFQGWRALTLTLVSVLSCVVFETLFNKIRKQKNTISDMSAVVTGILFAFNLPVVAPYWLVIFGAFFAIVVVKMLFGGIGRNFMNPALASRAVCMASWPSIMTTFAAVPAARAISFFSEPMFANGTSYDGVTSATPLASLKNGSLPEDTSLLQMFLGQKGGVIGEVCCAALLLGGIYLIVRKVISWHIPVAYIGTVAVITFLFHMKDGAVVTLDYQYMLAEICSGGLFLGAFFMATDYSTSPTTKGGKLIFGIGCGLLTVLLRYFGGMNEGVSYSILIMNIFAVTLDKLAKPRRYGKREAAKNEK